MCEIHETGSIPEKPIHDRSERLNIMSDLQEDHERLLKLVDGFKKDLTKKEKSNLSKSNKELIDKIKSKKEHGQD